MLTSAMPAVTRALSGVLPPAALKQLTQALGNCNQTLEHRGDILVRPDGWSNATNRNGVYTGYPPSVNEYNEYVNNYIGGGGGDVINSVYNNPTYTTNFDFGDVVINPPGLPGDPGRAGRDGIDGVSGVDGRAGRDGTDGAGGPAGPPGNAGAAGSNGIDGRDGLAGKDGAAGQQGAAGAPGERGGAGPAGRDGRDGRDGGPGNLDAGNLENVIRGLLARLLRVRTVDVITDIEEQNDNDHEVVTHVSFDAESCRVEQNTETIDGAVLAVLTKRQTVRFYGP